MVADHTKWGVVGLSTIVGLREADVLVSDEHLPLDARLVLSEHVRELILAPVASTGNGSE